MKASWAGCSNRCTTDGTALLDSDRHQVVLVGLSVRNCGMEVTFPESHEIV